MTIRVAVLGLGSVGKGVLEMIARKDLDIIVTGVADSKSGLIDPSGLDIGAVTIFKKDWTLWESVYLCKRGGHTCRLRRPC